LPTRELAVLRWVEVLYCWPVQPNLWYGFAGLCRRGGTRVGRHAHPLSAVAGQRRSAHPRAVLPGHVERNRSRQPRATRAAPLRRARHRSRGGLAGNRVVKAVASAVVAASGANAPFRHGAVAKIACSVLRHERGEAVMLNFRQGFALLLL